MNDHRVIDRCRLVASHEEEAVLLGGAPPLTGAENREGAIDKCRLVDMGESPAILPGEATGPFEQSDIQPGLVDDSPEGP